MPKGACTLCPEKATQSTSSASRSTTRCAASCAASSSTRAPCRRAMAVSRSTGQNSPVTLEAAVSTTSAWRGRRAVPVGRARRATLEQGLGVAGAAGHGQAHGVAAAPGQQRRVVLGGEDDHRGVARQRPGEQVDRVGGAAGEDDDVVLAGADEAGDLVAGGLVVRAGHPREPAGAAVHAGVGAGRGLDGPRHPLEGRAWMPRGRGWRTRPGRPRGWGPGRGGRRPAGRGRRTDGRR